MSILKQHSNKTASSLVLALGLLSQSAWASSSAANDLEAALIGGKPSIDLRLRVETVEQDNDLKDATAFTLRTRLGYKTASWNGFSIFGEYEGIAAFGGKTYAPEEAGRSVILDPVGEELNRIWLRWNGAHDTQITYGRQRLIYNNARIIGNVGWRQNEQTFSGVDISSKLAGPIALRASYLNNSHFINGQDRELKGFAINASSQFDFGSAYAYYIAHDFETLAGGTGLDRATLGARADVKFKLSSGLKLLAGAELAQQSDYADFNGSFSAAYYQLELGLAGKAGNTDLLFKLGREVLGSDDGNAAVAFPLATLHKFNGWADVFLATPADGLVDNHVRIKATFKPIKLTAMAVYHQFEADHGDSDYGSELDLVVIRPINKRLKFIAKYADYSADQFSVDKQVLWAQFDYKF